MKKILFIPLFIYAAFVVEYCLFNVFGAWFKPDLLLILVVFFNLYSGIRYSIYSAVVAGLIRDAVGIYPIGMHICVYIIAAYLTTYVRYNFYQPGSRLSRLWAVVFTLMSSFLVKWAMVQMIGNVIEEGFWRYIFWPEFIITSLVATYVFEKLKKWAYQLQL